MPSNLSQQCDKTILIIIVNGLYVTSVKLI
jgi:hypothetical protein